VPERFSAATSIVPISVRELSFSQAARPPIAFS